MICSRCGQPSPEGSTFCQSCGAPLTAQAPAYTPAYQPAYVPPVPRHPVIEAVRSVATSPSFLVAIIAFTVALVFSVLSAGETSSAMYDLLGELAIDLDMGEIVPEYTPSIYSASAVIGGIFGSIPTILVMVGLWMVYAAAKKNEPGISAGGMTLLWVMQIISLVGVCILAGIVLLVLLLVLLVGGLSVADIPDTETTIGFVVIAMVGLIFAGIMAFVIVCEVKVLKMVSTVRQTLMTGIPSDKISMLVVVMCIIGGSLSIMPALSSLVMGAFMSAVSTLASALASIMFGVVALKYRDTMRQLMSPPPVAAYAPVQPVYANIPTPPAPYNNPFATAEINLGSTQPECVLPITPAPAQSTPYNDPNPVEEQPEQNTDE